MKRLPLLILLVSCILCSNCTNYVKQSQTNYLRDSLLVEYISYAGQFYDSAFVDWDYFTEMGINQYSADWSPDIDKIIDPTWSACNAAALYWDRLQSAKICLHRKSLALRAIASKEMIEELDAIEQTFDDAFVEMVSQEYYLRVFQDVFDEVFSTRVDKMIVMLTTDRRK